jgi:hypothetical protein
LDFNGIPEKIPNTFYMRVPLWRVEPDTYLDWKRRRAGLTKLLGGTQMEINRTKLEVDRIMWERTLRARPQPTEDDFALKNKIIDILDGISLWD